MLTADDVRSVSIFSDLSADECGRLARVAADIRLQEGEYAIHVGDERALYAVLEGRLETIGVTDGISRVVGGRAVGDLVGEVPIALGTPFPLGFRAAEATRLLRLTARDYHALVAAVPEIGVKVGALARDRIGGLQGITADRPPPRAIVLGERWDAACAQLRRFLDRNEVTFTWLTPDLPEAAEQFGEPLPEELPVLRIVDGHWTLPRPEPRRVAELLGLATRPRVQEYDAVIVGAGPAGLAAAVYGASEGLRTIVVEREAPGGQAGTSSRIENYLGFPSGVSGDELASRALQQAQRLGAEILVTRAVSSIEPSSREVQLDGGDVLTGQTIILACGVSWRRLPIEGFDRLIGKGVAYGAARSEASNVHGLDIHIVGAGNSAGQAALFFSTYARSVTILCRGEGIEKSMSRYLIDQLRVRDNVRAESRSEVTAVYGEESLEALDVRNNASDETVRLDSGGLFIFIGADAETGWLPSEIALDRGGYVLTGPDVPQWGLDRDPYLLETSVPGIFACGDVRFSPVKRVAAAVGEGSMAIAFVHQYLRSLDAEPVR